MGTNYYARFNECDHCGRYDEMHIGKSLHTVRVYPYPDDDTLVTCFRDWRLILGGLNPPTVWDEYGDQVTDVPGWLDRWKPHPDHELYDLVDDFIDVDGFYCIASEFS